jgi:hypothetical protein
MRVTSQNLAKKVPYLLWTDQDKSRYVRTARFPRTGPDRRQIDVAVSSGRSRQTPPSHVLAGFVGVGVVFLKVHINVLLDTLKPETYNSNGRYLQAQVL